MHVEARWIREPKKEEDGQVWYQIYRYTYGLVLSGYNKNGEQTEHYYYGNSLLAAEYTDKEVELYYYLKNSHGDVIGLTDNNGTLTEAYRYDAFGTLTSIQSINNNGVLVEAETALSRFLYAGEQRDAVTELYYLRARQYDTVIGRFTQEDTYLGDGRNLYVYVGNNPLKYVDPSGHEKTGGYNTDRINDLYLDMTASADPKAYIEYQEEHKAWFDTWNFVENKTENLVVDVAVSMLESIGAKLDFASGYVNGLWNGFTQMPSKDKSYIVSEQSYDEGLIMGNLSVYAADLAGTFISGAATGASATASVVATVGGGYVVVPGTAALTDVLATSTVYFAGRAKNDASRLEKSIKELFDDDSDNSGRYKKGDKTSAGREYTKHGAQRANERGFTSGIIDSIIDNNSKTRVKEIDDVTGEVTWRYQDKRGNTIITNEWGDEIVTVYSYPIWKNNGKYIPK